jgi:hypothetical protein
MTHGQRRTSFSVDDATGSRFDLAMERFRSGETFEFRDVGFRLEADGAVHCIVDSSWSAENTTSASAVQDLDSAEVVFKHLTEHSPEFAATVGGRPVSYDLVEDYGMGSVLICRRRDESLVWARGFPRGPDRA